MGTHTRQTPEGRGKDGKEDQGSDSSLFLYLKRFPPSSPFSFHLS